MSDAPVPITVFTGYLGSGKTTIILNLMKQLDPSYEVVWLKNEYGNLNIDGELAKEENIEVKEMLNGCLCCVLVGKLGNAVEEILEQFRPDRIIIESSGTAYPLPIALELSKLPQVHLDAIINVIDAFNFTGYKDKGEVARMQAEATDLILINKAELVDEQRLENVMDEVFELNPETPKLVTDKGNIGKEIIFGLDSKLAEQVGNIEVENHDHHHPDEVETIEYEGKGSFEIDELTSYLVTLKDKDFIRIKGIVSTPQGIQLVNWVFGGVSWQPLHKYKGNNKIVFMGKGIANLRQKVVSKLEELSKN